MFSELGYPHPATANAYIDWAYVQPPKAAKAKLRAKS